MAQVFYPSLNLRLRDELNQFGSDIDATARVDEGYYPTLNIRLTDELNTFSADLDLNYPVIVAGYIPTLDIELADELNNFSSNITLEPAPEPPPPEDNLPQIRALTSAPWQRARTRDSVTNTPWQQSRRVDINPVLPWGLAEQFNTQVSLVTSRTLVMQDRYINLPYARGEQVDKDYKLGLVQTLIEYNKSYDVASRAELFAQDSAWNIPYIKPDIHDVGYDIPYQHVNLTGSERETITITPPPPEQTRPPYLPTVNIPLVDVDNQHSGNLQLVLSPLPPTGYMPTVNIPLVEESNKHTGDLELFDEFDNEPVEPEDPEVIVLPGRLQPTGSPFKLNFERALNPIDVDRTINWGYGLNNFVIGGVTTVTSGVEPAPPEPEPPIVHINYEVYRVVNTVNITVRPGGEIINFDNFRISRDVESFAWTATFDVLDRESYNLIRPVGRSVKTVDININGTVFSVFIGRSNTRVRATQSGNTQVYSVTGWSSLKGLSYPYARRRSFTDNQARTAAQIAVNELTGTGFTSNWSTTDWQVPAGVHSYQNKTALGAILNVVNAIGGVIVPHLSENSFTVRPYYPVSPWNWDDEFTQINREMNESQFFAIDQDTIPRDNPNGVYVYGEEQGAAVFARRIGTAGNELLPDVVDRYITANTAGQERGRIEVARNSFIESIPMTTYVDENGIIMPQELIEFTDLDGNKWRGMVIQTTVTCTRIGTALSQQITVARFFDG